MSDADATLERTFQEQRPALERLAYRMLGSLADAEDVVQEAWLRWSREASNAAQSARAYLSTIVVHLCIDRRRSIESRKESYVGPWLPEPVIESATSDAAESVSLALMVVLETLSPVERAAYLLRRVFDYGYDEIGAILEKSEPACRQLVHRAEERVRAQRPRFEAESGAAERITGAFLHACASGDLDGIVKLLAEDAVLYSDGGGKATAALQPIRGADKIARFFLGILKKAPAGLEIKFVRVNGRPGVVALEGGRVINVLTLDVIDGRVASCFIVVNPDKLGRIAAS